MAIISCKYDLQNLSVEIDKDRNRSYTLRWRVVADQLQIGVEILMQCIGIGGGNDPVPVFGAAYSFDGAVKDLGSFAQKFSCQLEMEDDEATSGTGTGRWYIYTIEVGFEPPESDDERERQKLQEPNPLLWDTEYWIEWVEEQVPVEEAYCLINLPTILRGPAFGNVEPGPVVNAAGQQTVDPLTKPEFHPVLCARQNYKYGHVANLLNDAFRDTVNGTEFLGDPIGSWRFMVAEAEKEKIHYPFEDTSIGTGGITYVPVTVKLEYKGERTVTIGTGTGVDADFTARGWDRVILNNGQVCFKRFSDSSANNFIQDPRQPGHAMLFPAVVYTLKEEFDQSLAVQPSLDDLIEVEAAEPVNLKIDGTQILRPAQKANHIVLRHYENADYTPDTFASGSGVIGNYKSPWKEILEEYETLYP